MRDNNTRRNLTIKKLKGKCRERNIMENKTKTDFTIKINSKFKDKFTIWNWNGIFGKMNIQNCSLCFKIVCNRKQLGFRKKYAVFKFNKLAWIIPRVFS